MHVGKSTISIAIMSIGPEIEDTRTKDQVGIQAGISIQPYSNS